jgi:hypothetical protein
VRTCIVVQVDNLSEKYATAGNYCTHLLEYYRVGRYTRGDVLGTVYIEFQFGIAIRLHVISTAELAYDSIIVVYVELLGVYNTIPTRTTTL